ncbi:hypothetical protein B0T21DRAFT_412716 [Apiosordaria backusii]|uniref:Uncharacterized protein n=1 Tax=Apiosordaria backusii TaxID=314023 RepID=A0AA40EA85_9PEZI|nr:hypothetical protein B0T21DRAFT_412716 [Apiosordaria backusii]
MASTLPPTTTTTTTITTITTTITHTYPPVPTELFARWVWKVYRGTNTGTLAARREAAMETAQAFAKLPGTPAGEGITAALELVDFAGQNPRRRIVSGQAGGGVAGDGAVGSGAAGGGAVGGGAVGGGAVGGGAAGGGNE